MNRAIFLDRDGVINKFQPRGDKDKPEEWNYILSWNKFEFEDGVFEAFKLLEKTDYIPIVVSNQSCVGKGLVTKSVIKDIFDKMTWELALPNFTAVSGENVEVITSTTFKLTKEVHLDGMVDAEFKPVREIRKRPLWYYFCPHAPDENCACRKPKPGMIWQAAVEYEIDLSQSWIIGDSLSDIIAGKEAGIPRSNRIRIEKRGGVQSTLVDKIYESLLEAVKYILELEK